MRFVVAMSLLSLSTLASASESSGSEEVLAALSGGFGWETQGIINGDLATRNEFPMAGGLLLGGTIDVFGFQIEGRLVMCSSTLIAPDVVLLAAHCVDLDAMTQMPGMQGIEVLDHQYAWSRQADLSEYQFTQDMLTNLPDWPEDVVFASKAILHPEWDMNALQIGLSENFDIGLLFLEEPVFDVPFAVLPTQEEDAQLVEGVEVDVVGWGQQYQDAGPEGTGVKVAGRSVVGPVAPYEFQVGPQTEDVRKCHGDSGGPSFMYVETDSLEEMRLVGVTSHAYDFTDCRLTGGVDTRVGHYLSWIHDEMVKGCEDGTRSWCEWPGIIPPPDSDGFYIWEQGEDDEGEGAKKGCGCSAAPGGAAGGLALIGLAGLLVRRRRPTA